MIYALCNVYEVKPRVVSSVMRDLLQVPGVTIAEEATVTAELYAPATAVEAGFLDRVTSADALLDEACTEAERLGALDGTSLARTKRRLRQSTISRIRAAMKDDIEEMTSGQ